jgi:hypothetical protein
LNAFTGFQSFETGCWLQVEQVSVNSVSLQRLFNGVFDDISVGVVIDGPAGGWKHGFLARIGQPDGKQVFLLTLVIIVILLPVDFQVIGLKAGCFLGFGTQKATQHQSN